MAYVEEAQQGAGQRPGDREEGQEPEIKDHLRHEQHQEFSMRVEGFLKIIAFMYRDRQGSSQFLFARVFLQSSLPFHFWPTCMALSGFQLKMFFAWKSHVHCTRAQSTSSSALELPDGQS